MSSLDRLLCAPATDCEDKAAHYVYDKPNLRRCSVDNCEKTAKRGGRCIAHGGGNKCAVDGCTTSVVSRGLCVAHGGGKRCQTPACTKSAQSGGFCWVHGGGKKCGYEGCPKRAQSGGACIAHGGGKRCRMDGCNKVVQYDGLCVGHGGYRRCVFESCDRRAMANDYCQQHGGSSVCILEHCGKRAVRGGMCSEHKAEASLQAVTASGFLAQSQLSGRRRRAARQKPLTRPTDLVPTLDWQGRTVFHEFTVQSSPEARKSTSDLLGPNLSTRINSTRSPSPVRQVDRDLDEMRCEDSPAAPGFSALLSVNDRFPSSFKIYARRSSAEDLSPDHGRKGYPVLPGIRALQNYTSTPSLCGGRLTAVSSETPIPTLKSENPELQVVVTEDPGAQKRMSRADHSYSHGQNGRALPCFIALSGRYAGQPGSANSGDNYCW